MELSDEQKQHILEEEQQRIAAEEYRTQVRRELLDRTDATAKPEAPQVTLQPSRGGKRILKALLLILCVGVLAILWIRRISTGGGSEPYAPSVNVFKHTEKIVSGQVTVKAGSAVYYRIPIKGVRDVHVTGHFLALGGFGNDIQVVLAEEKEFGKWMDGQQAKVYYVSEKVTTGDIDAKLPSFDATYYLCFSNKFSMIANKTINADISMSYSTLVVK
jgi:hypothetical protein